MAQEITYTDSSSVSVTDGIELGKVSILDIADPEVEWDLITECEGITVITRFIGGRPKK